MTDDEMINDDNIVDDPNAVDVRYCCAHHFGGNYELFEK